jgi:pre-mRNA-processing factor SLU7
MSTIIPQSGDHTTNPKAVLGVSHVVTPSVCATLRLKSYRTNKTVSGSYCTGDAGKAASMATSAQALLANAAASLEVAEEEAPPASARKTLAEQHMEDIASGKKVIDPNAKPKEREVLNMAKRVDAGDDVEIDKERLRKALAEEKKRKAMGEDEAWQQTKKSKMDVTQEELEAYRLSRQAFDDPMANYKDENE